MVNDSFAQSQSRFELTLSVSDNVINTLRKTLDRFAVLCFLFFCVFCHVEKAHSQSQLHNPLIMHPDPFITAHNGIYYALATQGNQITIWSSPRMELLGSSASVVWTPTTGSPGASLSQIYSPTLWQMNGAWWIYFTATADGRNEDHQIYVLQSAGNNPLGPYTYAGQMNTANSAIDPSILTVGGINYLMYVRFPGNVENDIYIAPLSDPLTFAGPAPTQPFLRPTFPWEMGAGSSDRYPVVEGPTALYHNGKTFIVYSGSDTDVPVYCLGLLTYSGTGNVTDPAQWMRSGPVFQESLVNNVYGPGRGTFTTSPDGQQDWLLFAAKTTSAQTFAGRTIRAQQFTYNADGSPNFGIPLALTTAVSAPSGVGGAVPAPSLSFTQQNDQLSSAPASAGLGNVLYVAFRANDASNTLWIDSTVDGSLLQGAQHKANISMGSGPAMKAFGGQLAIAFQSNTDDSLFVCLSPASLALSCTHINNAGVTSFAVHSQGSPSLWSANGRLYMAYQTSAADVNGINHIVVVSSADGATFDQGKVFGATSGTPPSIASYNGQVVIAFQSNDSRKDLYLQLLPYDLTSVTSSMLYPTQLQTKPALALVKLSTSTFPTLMLAFGGVDANQSLNYEPYYGVSLYDETQSGASIGSAPDEAVWTPLQGANANKPVLTVSFRSKDVSNHLWMGTSVIP